MRNLEDFFQHQVEECQHLAKRSLSKEDRAFWYQLAQRWEEQGRQFKQMQVSTSQDKRAHTRTTLGRTNRNAVNLANFSV